MAFSIVGSCVGGMNYGTPVTAARTGVTAGNLIVALVTSTRTGGSNAISVSDGTTSLTAGTANVQGDYTTQFFYLLSSVASGNLTYTASSTAASSMWIDVWEASAGASIDFDAENATAHGIAGYQVVVSGDITASGGIIFGGIHGISCNVTEANSTINDTSPDGQYTNGGNRLTISYLISAGFTEDAGFYLGLYSDWLASIIAFKESGGTPAAPVKRKAKVMLLSSWLPMAFLMGCIRNPRLTRRDCLKPWRWLGGPND